MTQSSFSLLETKRNCDFQPLKGIQVLWEYQLDSGDRCLQLPLSHRYIKMDNMDNFYSSMKLTKFGLGVRATCFVSFLAWTGVILSIVGLLFFSFQLISLITYGFSHQAYTGEFLGAFLFYISSSWLVLHLVLRKKNVQRDLNSIRRILKIKCFIIGGIEIIVSIVGIVAVIGLLAAGTQNVFEMEFGLSVIGIFLLLLAGSCSMIHGVRKDINSCINAYIIFNILYALILTVFIFSDTIKAYNILTSEISFALCIYPVFLFDSIGGLIVLYNINDHSTSNMYNKNLVFISEAIKNEKMNIQHI